MILVVEERWPRVMLEPGDVVDWMGGPVLTLLRDGRDFRAERVSADGDAASPEARLHPALYREPLLLADPWHGPMWCEDGGVLGGGVEEHAGVDAVREARYRLTGCALTPYSSQPAGIYLLERPSMYVMDDPCCLECGAPHCGGDCMFPGLSGVQARHRTACTGTACAANATAPSS